MLIKTIMDDDNGRKWEIYKESENSYYYKYYEFFNANGWKEHKQKTEYFTKDAIEFDFDIAI